MVYTGLKLGHVRERDHLEDLGVDEKNNIKKDLKEVEWGCMDSIDLAQDRDR
jgi:hypothetical protein